MEGGGHILEGVSAGKHHKDERQASAVGNPLRHEKQGPAVAINLKHTFGMLVIGCKEIGLRKRKTTPF